MVRTDPTPPEPTEFQKQSAHEFNFSKEMMEESRTWRLYKTAMDRNSIWYPREIDYTQDREEWEELSDEQKVKLLKITTKFFAGEQTVAEEIAPFINAAQELGRFDWVAHLSMFLMEEVKHAEFFAEWYEQVYGSVEPEEVLPYFGERDETVDPAGRFEITDVLHDALPESMDELMAATLEGDEERIKPALVRSATIYNAHAEGVLSRPSYEIVVDTCKAWGDKLPALQEGFRQIMKDEGRHIVGGSLIVRELIEENPEYEEIFHDVFDKHRGVLVGLVGYQKSVDDLDLGKYQKQKVRFYRNRCKEVGVEPDQELIDQILDPDIDFTVGVTAG